jgi:hypothetical protein
LQRKDDNPKTGRPSLLTPAQQAEADRNRILSTLESGGLVKPSRKPLRGRPLIIGGGVVALALLIGVGVWVARDAAQDQSLLAAAAVPPATAPTPASPAEVSADEVLAAAPAATINDDPAARTAPQKQESLRDMLDANSAPAKSDHDELSKALESTPAVARAAPKAAPKPAHADTAKRVEKAKPKPAAKAETKAAREPKNTPEQENDIALLSALVAHTQTLEAPETPAKVKPSLKQQLAQCKKFGKTKAEQCRERVCDGRSKTAECKVQR